MRLTAFIALLLSAPMASADPLLYRVDDQDSTVWILGSVHALQADDYPLGDAIESAYAESDRVVLEVDPAELQPLQMQAVILPLAANEDGRVLKDWFRDPEYARLRREIGEMGLSVEQFAAFEPWFVALQLFAFNLARFGYAASEGVDTHFAARAVADGKQTSGLETAREQLQLFDNLPAGTQKTFLFDTLEESNRFREEMERLVSLWRGGDAAALENLIDEEFANDPELRDAMLAERNRKWIDDIAAYLGKPGGTLVIVGALHLVGDQGVVELLESRGHDVVRVNSDER